jgi:hypothetical protein
VFTEFHSKMLDRIGSASEFGEFFGSEAGERFLESLASEKGAPQTRILAALQWGVTLLTPDVGAGTLIASFAAYLLSKRMGLVGNR